MNELEQEAHAAHRAHDDAVHRSERLLAEERSNAATAASEAERTLQEARDAASEAAAAADERARRLRSELKAAATKVDALSSGVADAEAAAQREVCFHNLRSHYTKLPLRCLRRRSYSAFCQLAQIWSQCHG